MSLLSALLLSSLLTVYGICSSGPTNVNDGNMGAVELVGNTKSIYETYDCPGVLNNQDKTSYVADLGRGQTYTVKWTVTSCSSMKDPIASAAWIDFNRDDSFDSSERLNPNPVTDYDTKEITFTVPVTAVLGNTIMRVQAQETTQTSQPLDPCFSFRWGGTKDFSIEITEPMKGGGKGSRSQGGLSGGSQILIVLFSFAFVYIVGGVAWNKRQGHEGCRSVFPHYDFWCIRLPILVKEGVAFCKSKITGKTVAVDDDDLL